MRTGTVWPATMPCMKAGLMAVLAAAALQTGVGPEPVPLERLLDRAAAYVARFVRDFSNVVAQEDYRQEYQYAAPRRRLKSDFLLVRYPGSEFTWLAFRDVYEVNGRQVRDQQDRLARLFLEPFADALRRAEEITRDASRHSLVDLGPEASPFAVIALLQTQYQPGYHFRLGDVEHRLGPRVRELEIEERLVPDPGDPAGSRVPLRAAAWVDEETGRVRKTELRLGAPPGTRVVATTFRFDEGLGIDVPEQMRDVRVTRSIATRGLGGVVTDQFIGTATYSRFRRFQVRTDEAISPEPAAR